MKRTKTIVAIALCLYLLVFGVLKIDVHAEEAERPTIEDIRIHTYFPPVSGK